MKSDALKGRLVLDVSTHLPGPFVGKLLAGQGARVVKIERPGHDDPAHTLGEFYHELNGEKEIIKLDLTADRAAFHDWVRKADALIEGYRPAAKARLGLDAAILHAINPRLCIASLVGYPEEGPWSERAGHDLNFQAVTGMLSLAHEMPAMPWSDLMGAWHAALSLTAALEAVARGGLGTRTVVSLSETVKLAQGVLVAEYRASGRTPQHGQNLFTGLYPCYRMYKSQDGRRIAVGAIEPKFWTKFCAIIGREDLVREGQAIGGHGREVIEAVQAALGAKPWSHWKPIFEVADCCVEPVLDYEEVYGQP